MSTLSWGRAERSYFFSLVLCNFLSLTHSFRYVMPAHLFILRMEVMEGQLLKLYIYFLKPEVFLFYHGKDREYL